MKTLVVTCTGKKYTLLGMIPFSETIYHQFDPKFQTVRDVEKTVSINFGNRNDIDQVTVSSYLKK
jgi:hypothetical protein